MSKNVWNRIKKQYEILSISHVFRHSINDIFWSSGWILMQGSVLETLLVVDYIIKISSKSLSSFIVKFGSTAEICWKLEELKWHFLNNSEVSSYLLGHILLFWKVTMQTIEWIQNYQWITILKKYLCRICKYGRCRGRMTHHRQIFHRSWRNRYFCTQ